MQQGLRVTIGQYSDKGAKEINQDFHSARIPQEPLLTTKGIAIALADGISSSEVSDIASRVSVSSFLEDYFATPETWSVRTSAERVIDATNSWLYAQSRQDLLHLNMDRGYVCTFSALVLRSNKGYIFHAGDTRIYRMRDQNLELLTEDHRLRISSEQSYLSRAMGMDKDILTDYERIDVEQGDIFLLMTDGVYEFTDATLIEQTLALHAEDFNAAAKALCEQALERGSGDNLTAQIVRIDALPLKDIDAFADSRQKKPFAPELEPRMEFDGYTIVRKLHGSNRSHLYLATDNQTQNPVVIKTPSIDLRENPAYLERFFMEEWIARRINNAHVMKAYEQDRERHYIYNVSEYLEGQTLTQWMIDHPNPSLETVRDFAEQIAKGLLAFHRQEMIHQDLRPENIMIDPTGTLKIIDFGSVRIEGIADINTLTQQDHLQGTALYSAPEYFLGEAGSFRSDIFSLGVIIYHLLSGKYPYGLKVARSKTKSQQKKLKYQPLHHDENRTLPIWIDEALRKALHPDPYKRYAVLSEFIYDLRHPNRAFVTKTKPPLIERDPVLFWKSTSLVLAITVLLLLLGK